jgi:UDP-3-O-[3-hydroxymyristoyl] glucosamine N-acyltransferase
MSGLSGSTVLGDGVLLGGGVGTSGHLSIGTGSVVHGRAAVTKDWPAGSKLAGAPAQDIREFWREIATVRRLSKGDRR